MVARIATYSFTGDAQELGKRAEAGILPILKAQPGFKSYSVAIGEGKVFSSSAWDSRTEAESGSVAVSSWVAENMTEISRIGDVSYAEVAFSTSLGVSTASSLRGWRGSGGADPRTAPPARGCRLANNCGSPAG